MDNMKRFVSMLLCFVMVLGFLPAGVLAVDASETPVDALVVFSDLHIGTSGTNAEDKQTLVNGVMTAISKDYTVSSVNSAGDMYSSNERPVEGTVSTVSDWIDDVFADADINYVWTDHDRATELSKESGLVYGTGEGENYYVYLLSMADMSTNARYVNFNSDAEVAEHIEQFETAAAGLDKTKPLFIVGHQPLFDDRGDNGHAYEWAVAINEAAQTMDVAYFFGHNHNYDDSAADYYVAKGDVMKVPTRDKKTVDVELNFTHINAGYMDPGTKDSNTRMGTALAVAIYDDEIVYTTYDSNGVYAGNYAVNETVAREFAKTETTAPTEAPELDLEDPQTATGSGTVTTTVEKEVYVLVDRITEEGDYVLSNTNTATNSAHLLTAGSNSVTDTANVTVTSANGIVYIENPAAAAIFNADSSSSGYKLYNAATSRYLQRSNSSLIVTNSSNNATSWKTNKDNAVYYDGSKTDRYIRYDNGWGSLQSNSGTVYIYQKQTIEVETTTTVTGTYSIAGEDVNKVAVNGATAKLTADLTFKPTSGTSTTTDVSTTAVFEIVSDPSGILSGISGNTATFTGTTGEAVVKVSYTTEFGEVTNYITVTATEPYYSLDLWTHDGTGPVEEITKPITLKNVSATTTYSVWAVIKYFDGTTQEGEDKSAVENPTDIVWTSSDPEIATVDPSTGVISFTGKSGSVNITATYQVGNKPSDTITISASNSEYIIPSDGSSDFPEYPHEGAIRFDKTAEAVGAFSETGVAKLELSMTGVPIKKGTDVIIMLDTSSSMTKNNVKDANGRDTGKTRAKVLEEALAKLLTQLKTPDADGNYMDINVAIADFNGYYGHNSGGTSGTPYDRTDGDYVKNGSSNGSGYTQPSEAKVYTGSKKLDAGAFTPVGDLAASYTLNYTSGTNYDYAFDAIYQLGTAIKAANTESRELIVIFMSDGATLQWNYFGTQNTYTKWNNWLAGTWKSSDLTTSNLNKTTHSYFYDLNDHDGDGHINEHRMANAIKGDPNQRYEIIRKSTAGLPNGTLVSAGKDYLYTVPGLGATMYTINFDAQKDGNITEASIDKALASTASDSIGTTQYYYKITSAEQLENAFTAIGHDITYAATNVVVTDKVADEYTMIFGIPKSSYEDQSDAVADALKDQEFYIEFLEYALDEDHERIIPATSKLKLYLGVNGNTYYAAKNAADDAFDAPTFATTKDSNGRLYWAQVDTAKAQAGEIIITVNDGTNWKFMEKGNGTHNMISGAYAYGTIDPVTNMSTDLVIVTPYFAYCADTRMLAWTVERLSTTEYVLNYFLYLDNSAADIGTDTETEEGPYPTNDYAYITYKNFNGNYCRQEFPIPKLTWNGAQVSYVFYLVNEQGQPINKSGQVVDFANATFVTDVFTKHVIWNDPSTPTHDGTSEGIAYLDANWEALQLLPEGYDLYDTAAQYQLLVYEDAGGENLGNEFTISGSSEGTEIVCGQYKHILKSEDTTKVYNTKASLNKYTAYGTYTEDDVADTFDFGNTTVAFAVVWHASLIPDVVVVDYGLDVLIDVVSNDMLDNVVNGISATNTAYGKTEMNHGINTSGSKFAAAPLTIAGNTVSLESERTIRFHQGDMDFNEKVVFYYESPVKYYEGSKPHSGHQYSSVTVIPATTIYYEDSFVDLTVWDMDNNLLNEQWGTAGEAVNATQAQDRPGASKISEALDADNNYGYDSAYDAMSQFSMGSARMLTVNAEKFGEAKFTFWGTGFDLISLTSSATGTIYVDVYNADEFASDGYDAKPVKSGMVDTYYGYTKNENGEWVVTPNTENALYQVPVAEVAELTYGHYTAIVTVAYAKYYDHVDAGDNGSYDFYLDAIRIYDPANDGIIGEGENADTTIHDAYVADGEGWPSYIELRNALIAASSFGDTNGDKVVDGMVFIDGDPTVGTANLEDYIAYGPNNEVYLAAGQSVAFLVDAPETLAKIQIGIKSADGKSCTYAIKNVTADGTVSNNKTFTVNTATDMYYDLTGWKDDIIVITNTGSEGIISITNIKSTYTEKPAEANTQNADEPAEVSIYMTAKAAQLVLNAKEPEAVKPEPVNPFADVQKADFYYDAVLWAVENGVTNGVDASHFGPYLFCNRAQVVTFLWRAAGSPAPVSRNNPFTDVPADSWYTDAVLWAVENGITNGLTATTFGPDAQCNRAQVVTFLWRANGSKVTGAANPFADVPADAFYHDAVIWALSNGITTGASANAFDPEGNCMRAHVVTFLYRAEQLPELSES